MLLEQAGQRFSGTFQRRRRDVSRPKPYLSEPVWTAALEIARREVGKGISRQDKVNVAGRSAEFPATHDLMNVGQSLKGCDPEAVFPRFEFLRGMPTLDTARPIHRCTIVWCGCTSLDRVHVAVPGEFAQPAARRGATPKFKTGSLESGRWALRTNPSARRAPLLTGAEGVWPPPRSRQECSVPAGSDEYHRRRHPAESPAPPCTGLPRTARMRTGMPYTRLQTGH